MLFAFGLSSTALAQTTNWLVHRSEPVTNVIPQNLFLTDNGMLFWYGRSGHVVNLKSISEAQKSLESVPADQDPQGHWGHWGQPMNGFQLSLRFAKDSYTNGEPILATVLFRNVTNRPVDFLRMSMLGRPSPINVLAFKNNGMLLVKGGDEIDVISATPITIYPQTQCKYRLNLNNFYDLTNHGDYVFKAEYGNDGKVESKAVSIRIQ